MSQINTSISFSDVDFASLKSDDDFSREAKRLLPRAITALGEAAGKAAWDQLQKELGKVKGMKLNKSASDRQKFIREAGENYRNGMGAADKRELEQNIIAQLREQAGG